MRPSQWQPPIELSGKEEQVLKRIRKAKLFVFLRRHRHEIFDEAFQTELTTLYRESNRGQPPIAPAMLAMVTLLQAYMGVSDDEAMEALVMDRRWQLVLDCLDAEEAPFSKGTLVGERHRLIAAQMDRRLVERTIELAERSGDFGSRALRAALDSSPLWGAGRVEDTYNLLGHAVQKVISVIAAVQGREQAVVAKEAGAELVTGSSLKASLDRDWDQKTEQQGALTAVLTMLQHVETWLTTVPETQQHTKAQQYLDAAKHVKAQNVNEEAGTLIKGVAKDRRCSIEDEDMRHGRKSKSVLIDGYKRHVLHDLDTGLVRAVGITAANAAEASVTAAISADLDQQNVQLKELHIDRAYLSSHLVREREASLQIYCKAWPVGQGPRFSKQAFHLDWERSRIRCPASVELPFTPGGIVHFPTETCANCSLREQCTTSPRGRSVSIHPDEALLGSVPRASIHISRANGIT